MNGFETSGAAARYRIGHTPGPEVDWKRHSPSDAAATLFSFNLGALFLDPRTLGLYDGSCVLCSIFVSNGVDTSIYYLHFCIDRSLQHVCGLELGPLYLPYCMNEPAPELSGCARLRHVREAAGEGAGKKARDRNSTATQTQTL